MVIKVTGGFYKGRRISTGVSLDARPTRCVVRQALFSMLEARTKFCGSVVLDVFCGSGSLSFEALSRGAGLVYMLDKSLGNFSLIKKTAEKFGVIDSIRMMCYSIHDVPTANQACDVIFIDPPYMSGLGNVALRNVQAKGWVRSGSFVFVEVKRGEDLKFSLEQFRVLVDRRYGTSNVYLLLCL